MTKMTSKFKGTCFECAGVIDAGTKIEWSKATGAKHADCTSVPAPAAVQPQTIPTTELGDFTAVYEMFASAAKTNKFPKITIEADGFEFYLYVSGPQAKISGVINVKSKGYGGTWYGRITEAGTWTHRDNVDERMADALSKLQMDPVAALTTFGKLSGRCCFCNIELTDEKSTSMGYGPICAKKWMLPWGKTAKAASQYHVADAKIEAAIVKAAQTGKPMIVGHTHTKAMA